MSTPPSTGSPRRACLVVGVPPRPRDELIRTAAEVAQQYGALALFATVDPSRYAVNGADGSTWFAPIDPDSDEPAEPTFDPEVRRRIEGLMGGLDVEWSTRCLVGDTATALAAFAAEQEAAMIVVGTREPGVSSGFREFLGGSVAVHLAHRQDRPVLVVPLHPVATDARLPWEAS
ncbi:MAG: universal stress protein [Arthrobacter sp.]|uniref:universal stress protein n=1 Tax=unclassified Arthrobacter TaxID=235627 RepID=UPI002655B942|nr:universal stress protein [Micrococcaceae bacterium]MDN5811726.1 universal stress protein [Micrococcaceae bacterium]MDN5822937.1 universal stress protein [Micrococcaceae bacterium]MDN5878677.1 universal stress protein [Micrococcaceae bacterium]MDN5886201.1 universal stress protein [Micrococcaceae bacterium]